VSDEALLPSPFDEPGARLLRYTLPLGHDRAVLTMPRGASILSAAPAYVGVGQYATPRADVWAAADPEQPTVEHRFALVGTGDLMRETQPGRLVALLVWDRAAPRTVIHLFDLGESAK
jgi:hypothetical protein